MLAKVKEYTLAELKKAYEAGASGEFVLEEQDYNTVKNAITSGTDISNILSLYENTMDGRMSSKEYSFLAKKTAEKNGIDTYVRGKNVALVPTHDTLDEALTAELNRIVNQAKTDIDSVVVSYEDYETAEGDIDAIVTDAKSDIDDIYTLVTTKKNGATEFDTYYNNRVIACGEGKEVDATGEELTTILNELARIADEAKVAMANAVTAETYNAALKEGKDNLQNFFTLSSTKINAKKQLKQLAGLDEKKQQEEDGEIYYYLTKLEEELNAGLAAIDAATVKEDSNDRNDIVGVNEALTAAQAKVNAIVKNDAAPYGLNANANATVKTINDYVEPLKATIPAFKNGETRKYIDAVQSIIDTKLSRTNIEACKSSDEHTALRTEVKKAIFEALKTHLTNLLNEFAALKINSTTTNVLSLAKYDLLQDNLDSISNLTYEENDDASKLTTLITSTFADMYEIKTQTALAQEMKSKWEADANYTALNERVLGYSNNYNALPSVVTALKNANFESVKSASEYKGIVDSTVTSIISALKTDLKANLTSQGKEIPLGLDRASTIAGVIEAYKTAVQAE